LSSNVLPILAALGGSAGLISAVVAVLRVKQENSKTGAETFAVVTGVYGDTIEAMRIELANLRERVVLLEEDRRARDKRIAVLTALLVEHRIPIPD
jgi:hypothetical protein